MFDKQTSKSFTRYLAADFIPIRGIDFTQAKISK